MPLAQTVTVLNKSGKVVNTSKHLVSVWKEAKAAYISRKAELNHKSKKKTAAITHEAQARRALGNISLSDEHLPRRVESSRQVRRSHSASRRPDEPHSPRRGRRNTLDRGYSDSVIERHVEYKHPSEMGSPNRNLIRRNTSPVRPRSSSSYDEHLAYGSIPPELPPRPSQTENELRSKMSMLNRLLDEADCLQYSATSTIAHLQKNPDALAAVALTLAEVSAMVSKLGPGALTSAKVAFPAVIALLASPEFLIAGGVAVGVTVVMLGGYKIIKRIQQNKKAQLEDNVTELRELEGDLSRIEMWRRGIADQESRSVGTTVEGEFITPGAGRRLVEEGVLAPEQVVSPRKAKSESSKRHRRPKSAGDAESTSRRPHRSRASASVSSKKDSSKVLVTAVPTKRRKAMSGIKMLFGGRKVPVPSS
jgi:hypothetical protein